MKNNITRRAVILAAGSGTRFQSEKPKVLHKICGRPMIHYVLDQLSELDISETFVVLGTAADKIKSAISDYPVSYVLQQEPLGPGDALGKAIPALEDVPGAVLVLLGDNPLIGSESLELLIKAVEQNEADIALLAAKLGQPVGPICFNASPLRDAATQSTSRECLVEYHLEDLTNLIRDRGGVIQTVPITDSSDPIDVNTRADLAEATRLIRKRINTAWMMRGVTMIDPDTVYLDSTVELGSDCHLYPNVTIEGSTRIGNSCVIGPAVYLDNSVLDDEVYIEQGSVIRESKVDKGTKIGPYAHLRSECSVGSGVRIGNFVELKATSIGNSSSAAHLTYLGDAVVGKKVNVGAGTITCNYDGLEKHETAIEDGVFIGSNSQLVAPVRIGKGAWVAAGSTVTEPVPENALAIARSRQINKEGWRQKRRRSND
jgi:bifunctional UDP-N-acetylglucosamine pyrophosphorylase/glucosamine-1-phosphate N-acetyltransferase